MQARNSILICHKGNGLAIRRDLEFFNIPLDVISEGFLLLCSKIHEGEAPHLRCSICHDINAPAVFAELWVVIIVACALSLWTQECRLSSCYVQYRESTHNV